MARKKKTTFVRNAQATKKFMLLKKAMRERLPRFSTPTRRSDANGSLEVEKEPLPNASKTDSKKSTESMPSSPETVPPDKSQSPAKNSDEKDINRVNIVKFTVQQNSNNANESTDIENSLPLETAAEPIKDSNKRYLSETSRNSPKNVVTKIMGLQYLTTNSIPAYVPKSPPNFCGKGTLFPVEYHSCTECGDTFVVKSSLAFHLERRSVYIKFPCKTCNSNKIFYNRCTLLKHIREHADKGEESDIEKAEVSMIPRSLLNVASGETSSVEEELADDIGMSPTEMMECSLREESSEVEMASETQTTEVVQIPTAPMKFKCLDCGEDFSSQEARAAHMVNNDAMPSASKKCTKCSLICPSKCSLKAHQRIHLQVSPYVCPECGDSPDPHWITFQRHVNFKCFHNSRTVGFTCPCCKRVFPNFTGLLNHMQDHSENYIKCKVCPRAYMSITAFNVHVEDHHKKSEGNIPWKMIYKCSLCDVVFLDSEQIKNHQKTHLKADVGKYYFNCMQCGKALPNKPALLEHVRTIHPKVYKAMILDHAAPQKEAAEPAITFSGKVECLLCHSVYHSPQGYNFHVSRAHLNVNQPCTSCYMIISDRKMMMSHGKTHMYNGNSICLLCNNMKFQCPALLDTHLKKHVERLKHASMCPICGVSLETIKKAHEHLRKDHLLVSAGSAGSNIMLATEPSAVSCHFCRASFLTENLLQEHLKVKHNVNNPAGPDKSSIFGVIVATDPTESKTDGDVCSKCGFTSANRTEFKTHIATHKQHKYSYQCQVCSECYIVESSLLKHLVIAHKMKEPQKYIDEEGTNYESDHEDKDKIAEDSLICSVCFTSFSDEVSLKTHMRSHGMAFIQAKKATTN